MKQQAGLFFALCGVAGSAVAGQAGLTPKQTHELVQQYARSQGLCSTHGAGSKIANEECPRVAEFEKKLTAAGLDPREALSRLFDGCRRYSSAYMLASISRDNRQPPASALAQLKAEKWLKVDEKTLKSVVNTTYFEPWALALPSQQLTRAVDYDCRYGPDPRWQPLR
ncbi:hypothetical protein [Achromobacter xylosoxidans]|uniref:hypothetical protein n=1 Tax=Alcaligenes xylosoxydans xylosoxydans TaxID=85698 RepID=UPI002A74EB99|nr:hypothetical protein [Achromobacter xylosoxidans]WPQ34347.1 hypothetical protein SLH34_27655 [Achromobacter xylosoxidans]